METMTKMERIDAALKGEEVDRVPISFWRHFYQQERNPSLLADAMLAFQRDYEWDFVKVNPRASYHTEGWGNYYEYSDDPHRPPVRKRHAVHVEEDWARIAELDIWKTDALKQQLVLIELMKEGLQGENVYFLHTIFSPLAVAYRLAGHSKERLAQAMESEPEELKGALEAITNTFVKYVEATLNAGASGDFYSPSKLASADTMTPEQYDRFGIPYDLRVLAAAADRTGFNLLHLCGDHIFLEKLKSYPVDAISWDPTLSGNPELREGRQMSGKMVVGGLSDAVLASGKPEMVAEAVAREIAETGGRGIVIAPGCVLPTNIPVEMLDAALAALDGR
ncbi:MAG TPA: uroporphyrinogen decarboxylase family protein [Chloroflexota bacterium]|nr:uroporphyrinogen decarboxylase family protein [Chloroflexota bacterium]